jgi:hypothetical protein
MSGTLSANPVSPFDDGLPGDAAGGKGREPRPSLDDRVDLLAKPTLGLGSDVHPVLDSLPVNRGKIADVRLPGRNMCHGLAHPFELCPLLSQAKFGDRPSVGVKIDPFLLAGKREPPVLPSARSVP